MIGQMNGNLVMLPHDVALDALDGRLVAGLLASDDAQAFDLEDAVVPVHYLLSGDVTEGPLAFLVAEQPVRVFEPASVVAIADAVESIAAKLVHARLASAELRALPPFSGRALEDDDKEWLLAVLQGVMVFMRRAATDGAPVLVVLR